MENSQSLLIWLNTFLTYAGVTLLLLLCIIVMRDGRQHLNARLLSGLCFCLAGLSVAGMPDSHELPKGIFLAAMLTGIPNLGLMWWLCLSVLSDNFKLDLSRWVGMIGLSVIPSIYFLNEFGVVFSYWSEINTLGSVVPLVMVGHIVLVAAMGLKNDLLERRRRLRFWLVVLLMLASIISLLGEQVTDPLSRALYRHVAVLPFLFGAFYWFVGLKARTEIVLNSAAAPIERPLSVKDVALNAKLLQLIEVEQAFLDPTLSIGELAERLGEPAHRLRHVINVELGHRNFATYLGHYRTGYAKHLLADPNHARDTMIQIAFGSGFSSLQSFNRVFKNLVGTTPTNFRETAIRTLLNA